MTARLGGTCLILEALHFAAGKHRDQRRKDTKASPYINHPIALARVLATIGRVRDPITLAAALLHDTIEDTDTTAEELHGRFGAKVAAIVEELTDLKWLRKASRKRIQVARAHRASPSARRVKLADKICNLEDLLSRPPIEWNIERQREYFDWARSVVNELRGTNQAMERRFDRLYQRRP